MALSCSYAMRCEPINSWSLERQLVVGNLTLCHLVVVTRCVENPLRVGRWKDSWSWEIANLPLWH